MATTKIKVTEITGFEKVERDATAEDLAVISLISSQADLTAEILAQRESEKAALLTRLGITADEAKLLLS